ncbi:MAG: tRNA (adenosine(37)-N6)-threonylcarbamoyltransferase complex transferase subunit TsaD [Candidatus Aminicenantes bacterium RBG_13_63_10]|nr:MAG: tRNA (adenosine(37)-N6)-threonylcarbamoyltransferase complex transferase subunit TsaD [Candidatus Aminicenantes bacterium RBG_13_63_10]
MILLAIETSCDETSAAVLDGPASIRSNVVLSQDAIHAPFGGVVPELASRQHVNTIGWVVRRALEQAGVSLGEVDLFAVTQGPGLIGSLLVGLSFAKGLAYVHRKPLLGIDHIEAHIEAALAEHPGALFPCLALVVSGGHTSIFLLDKELDYRLLGRTRDDAAGEALDKVAKFLDLGYPGGPVIEKLAAGGDPRSFAFGSPQMTDRSLDFSFSGLKTAALRHIREQRLTKTHARLPDFLASFEHAVTRAVLDNLERAADLHHPRSVVLSGGVARNARLRRAFQEFARERGLDFFMPSPRLCTDNAGMVGVLAWKKSVRLGAGSLDLALNAYPRFIPPTALLRKKKPR